MHNTLRALVSDLEIRCEVLLGNLPGAPAAEIALRVETLNTRVTLLRSEARALLGKALEDPALAQVHYDDYLHLSRTLSTAERFELPVIMRWDEPDRQITEMCSAMLDQVGWHLPRPLVGTVSHDYYMALASRSLIFAPVNEHERLLAIGDLAHELGHLALERNRAVLIRDTPQGVIALAKALAGASAEGSQRAFQINTAWLRWLTEFVCDGVATYLTGPAFALQNLRLCGIEDLLLNVFDIHEAGAHPPDDARMQVALHMLRLLGLEERATSIAELWSEALAVAGVTPDNDYIQLFPEDLLELTMRNVQTGCSELGLRPYSSQIIESCDVTRVANEAWEKLLADPANYAGWERQRLADCRPVWSTTSP